MFHSHGFSFNILFARSFCPALRPCFCKHRKNTCRSNRIAGLYWSFQNSLPIKKSFWPVARSCLIIAKIISLLAPGRPETIISTDSSIERGTTGLTLPCIIASIEGVSEVSALIAFLPYFHIAPVTCVETHQASSPIQLVMSQRLDNFGDFRDMCIIFYRLYHCTAYCVLVISHISYQGGHHRYRLVLGQ